MDEQAKIDLERKLLNKADGIRKEMERAYAQHNIVSRVTIDSGLGKATANADIVDPEKLTDDYDPAEATPEERSDMAYHIIASAILFYSDIGPTESRTIAQMAVNRLNRSGVFAGLSEKVNS